MPPSTETATNNYARSGLAILFAAIDYHQSSNQISSLKPPASSSIPTKSPASPTNPKRDPVNVNPFRSTMDHSMREYVEARALNPNMLDEEAVRVGFVFPERGTNIDIKWIGEGNLSMRQRKMNRRSMKRFHSKQNKTSSTEMVVSIPLPDSVAAAASSATSVHPTVSPSSSTGSAPASLDDHLSVDDGSIYSSPVEVSVEVCPNKIMSYEAACQGSPDRTMANLRRHVSIDPDDLAARMKQQQQRLFDMSQKTQHSRALLHGMIR